MTRRLLLALFVVGLLPAWVGAQTIPINGNLAVSGKIIGPVWDKGGAVYNVKAYGVVGDGVADDTTAIQALLNLFGRSPNASGYIYFPVGAYKITQTLTYEGTPALGLRLQGALGGTRGTTGARLVWAGASGGTMLYLLGANGSTIEQLEFQGSGSAKIGLQIDAVNSEVSGSAGSEGNVLRRLGFGGFAGAGSACIVFGHAVEAITNDISSVFMEELTLNGNDGATAAGIQTLASGNAKNFYLNHSFVAGMQYGIDWLFASGVFVVRGVTMYGNTVADIRTGPSVMHVEGLQSESQGVRFVTGSTGGNPGHLTITGSSWEGSTPSDDIMIEYAGSILLLGNVFYNLRTSTSVPKVSVTGNLLMGSVAGASSGIGHVVSLGNYYQHAPLGSAPLYDCCGNAIVSATGFYADNDLGAISLGDYGGDATALAPLTNWMAADARRPVTQTFATLGTPANGRLYYCTDCTKTTPCAGSGTGALAKRLNGAWDCN